MIGFNHGLVGGAIAHFLPLPIALPAAFCSHFVLDMLPHYGTPHKTRDNSRFWKLFFICDSLATLGLALFAILDHHYAMFLGGLAAVIPDFIWVARVIRTRSFDLSNNNNWFTRFHVGIQRYEWPGGLWIELPLAAALFYWVFFVLWKTPRF